VIRFVRFLAVVGFLGASAVSAQTASSDSDVKHYVSGAHFQTTSPSGNSQETWVGGSDGSTFVTRSGALGQKTGASSSAEGVWSINDAGQYCLHADWGIRQGGAEDWCAPITVGADISMTLTLADGRIVAVKR
jgi:hypothetical protein